MRLGFTGRYNENAFKVKLVVGAANLNYDRLRIEGYYTAVSGGAFHDGSKFLENGAIWDHRLKETVREWQFMSLSPGSMVDPKNRSRAGGRVALSPDGSNVAEYLHAIRELEPEVFEGIVETFKFVLPYTRRLQPVITSELDRKVYLHSPNSASGRRFPGGFSAREPCGCWRFWPYSAIRDRQWWCLSKSWKTSLIPEPFT